MAESHHSLHPAAIEILPFIKMFMLPNLPHKKSPSDPYVEMIYVQPNYPSCIIKFTPMYDFYIGQYDIFISFKGIKSLHFSCKTKHTQDMILEGLPSQMNKLSTTKAERL